MPRRSSGPAAELFGEGWTRIRGRGSVSGRTSRLSGQRPSARISRAAQMIRAAQGHRAAVFKFIRKGGCHTGSQLRSQLTYLTTKSSLIFDAEGEFDGRQVLSAAEIQAVAQRFEDGWTKTRELTLGHTSHLLMSFPIGTKAEDVREIVRGICDETLRGEGAHFDYLVAVHTDRAHPHAHIIVNRQSPDGELFSLRRDHHFSYQVFREAMVEHGERHGVRLEATQRLDRGIITYAAHSEEVHQAREEHRTPVERHRYGQDLERALEHVASATWTYRGLAAEASAEGFEEVSEALMRASTLLAHQGAILPTREVYMAQDDTAFYSLVEDFSRSVRDLEDHIATARPAERPRLELGLNEVLTSVSELHPLGANTPALREAATTDGLYSRGRINAEALDQFDSPRERAALETALRGTGISSEEIVARLRVGADNAALEQHWLASDVRATAAHLGAEVSLDRRTEEARERVLDALDSAHERLERVLVSAGVLQDALQQSQADHAAEHVIQQRAAEVVEVASQADPATISVLRDYLERTLTSEQIERLAAGNTEVLAELDQDELIRSLGTQGMPAHEDVSHGSRHALRESHDHEEEGPIHE